MKDNYDKLETLVARLEERLPGLVITGELGFLRRPVVHLGNAGEALTLANGADGDDFAALECRALEAARALGWTK